MMASLEQRLEALGQSHVLQYASELTAEERASLWQQLLSLPLERVPCIYRVATETASSTTLADIEPPPPTTFYSNITKEARSGTWFEAGRQLIREGKAGVCVLAGGQATRLGVPYPKGMLVLPNLESGKSLFQLQAEKVLRAQELAGGGMVQFLLMTSEATHTEVTSFFEQHSFFGLSPSQVHFFQQGTLPCLTQDSAAKMILETKYRVATAPNGNGGIYSALRDSGVLAKLQSAGVENLQVFSVDNPLARIADISFFGLCKVEKLEAAAKCTAKVSATEAVGVFTLRSGRWGVTEYSEIGTARASLVNEGTGQLKFNAANLAIHAYALPFLAKCADAMERPTALYHVAKKDIPCLLSPTGKTPAIKLEAFIFDVFELAEQFGLIEVTREDEFSAVKNAEGAARDTPATARADLDRLHRKWLTAAGAHVIGTGPVEVSPLVSLAGEGLESLQGRTLTAPIHIAKL